MAFHNPENLYIPRTLILADHFYICIVGLPPSACRVPVSSLPVQTARRVEGPLHRCLVEVKRSVFLLPVRR